MDDTSLLLTFREGVSPEEAFVKAQEVGILVKTPTTYWRVLGHRKIRVLLHGLEERKGQGYFSKHQGHARRNCDKGKQRR